MSIYETDWVDAGDYKMHQTVIVEEGAKVGKNSILHHHVYVYSGAEIGENCKIQANNSICPGTKIGDNVFVGPGVIWTNVLRPRAFIENKKYEGVTVKENATIGGGACLKAGVVIGSAAMVGLGAVVLKDVEPYATVLGNPARIVNRTESK